MRIEHIGFLVSQPIAMGDWYEKHLGLKKIRSLGDNEQGVVFLRDDGTGTVLEFGRLKGRSVFNYNNMDPLLIHIAIECQDPTGLAKKLEAAGAEIIGESPMAEGANERMLVKDPWGITIQLINRVNRLNSGKGDN
ncbi:MAG: VOC family protein [Spirochaetales bacterium]|nr:VOC family protein [Spirochaetales bacterium]